MKARLALALFALTLSAAADHKTTPNGLVENWVDRASDVLARPEVEAVDLLPLGGPEFFWPRARFTRTRAARRQSPWTGRLSVPMPAPFASAILTSVRLLTGPDARCSSSLTEPVDAGPMETNWPPSRVLASCGGCLYSGQTGSRRGSRGRCPAASLAQCGIAFFPGADADGIHHRNEEDLAVTNLSSSGSFSDYLGNMAGLSVWYHDL